MRVLNTHFDPQHLYWQDYLPLLRKLLRQFDQQHFPTCEQLNSLLRDDLTSQGGHAIRFVPSTELDDGAYEHRIYTTGQVSTRPQSWHDLFNAMVWIRFPRIKTAMNALHYQAESQQPDNRRGALRDALTLFDESGVIVCSSHRDLLTALSRRQWPTAFQSLRSNWHTDLKVVISGHAILEKYLSPYKSMTAKALLIQTSQDIEGMSMPEFSNYLDEQIATQLLAGNILKRPANLAPLPLAGIPGWWPDVAQDELFYADKQVFRPPSPDLVPAPITRLS